MFLIFIIALVFFMVVGLGVVLIINKVLNGMEKDNARTDVYVNDIYADEVFKYEHKNKRE